MLVITWQLADGSYVRDAGEFATVELAFERMDELEAMYPHVGAFDAVTRDERPGAWELPVAADPV